VRLQRRRGLSNGVSLTALCAERTGVTLKIGCETTTHPADIPYDVTDNTAVTAATGWSPVHGVDVILEEIVAWLTKHRPSLEPIFGQLMAKG
jgi:CDP-paratose 2-epimerase